MRQSNRLPTILFVLLIGIIALLSITQLTRYETVTHAQSKAPGKPVLVYPKIGHTESINCIAYSPDMRFLASGSADKTIKLWLAEAGIPVKTLAGHKGSVESIAFSPNGRLIVSGSADKTIILWDAVHGTLLRSLTGHEGTVLSVAFSPDGETIASSSGDKTVRLWNTVTGKQLSLPGHNNFVLSVAFSPDGKVIASGGADQTVILWDMATGNQLRSFAGHKDTISSVAFSPDGKTLASGSWDQTVKLWDMVTGRELTTLTWHSSIVTSITFSPDGKLLASGSDDKTVKLWSVATGRELRTLKDHSRGVTSVAFNPNGKLIASGSKDKTIDVWSISDGLLQKTLKSHASEVSSVAYSSDGALLACGSYDNVVRIWDLKKGELARVLAGHTNTVTSVTFSPNGRTLASGSADNTVKLWDVATGAELRTLRGHTKSVTAVAFNVDEVTLASGSLDTTIKVWETASGRELRTLTDHTDAISTIAFNRGGTMLASGSWDKTIKLWDTASGQMLRTLNGHSREVKSIAFSSNGTELASGSADQTIKLWDSNTGTNLRTLTGHSGEVNAVAFSNDRKKLASGGSDNAIKLWEVSTGRELSRLTGHSAAILSVDFSVDGQQLASAAADATIKLWSAANGKDLATLIAVDDKDWIVVDAEERFDASSNSQSLMYWSIGNELISLSQLKDRFYEPGLLGKILGSDSVPLHNVDALREVELYPDVACQLDDAGTKLNITLVNRGGGIGQVRVLVNGRELIADARPPGFDSNQSQALLTVDISGAPLISGQDNSIRVVAHNLKGDLASPGTRLAWRPKGIADAAPPNFYAIVVGTSNYTSPELNLRYAAQDAGDMANALELGAKRLFGAQRAHVQLFSTDKANPRAMAPTKSNISKAFEQVTKARPQDVFVIYFAGYGITLQDSYLYLTQEAHSTESATFGDSALRAHTTISSEELVEWIKRVPALKRAMILDTCANQPAADKLIEKRNVSSAQIRATEQLKDRTGFHVLLGVAADAVSYEASPYGQSLMTYALLQGMRGAALREDYLDVSLLFQYVADAVPQLARNIGGIQRPWVARPTGGSFDIGRFSIPDRAAISLPLQKPLVLRPILINGTIGYDDLDITRSVIKGLQTESSAGNQARMVFVNADEMYSAIQARGVYNVSGGKVRLGLRFIKDRAVISNVNVEGLTSDLKGLIALVTETIVQETTGAEELKKKRPPSILDLRQFPTKTPTIKKSGSSKKMSFIHYDFHHRTANRPIATTPSSVVVVRPVIRNNRTNSSDDLQVQDEVVKVLRAWSENKADSVLIDFRDVDHLEGAYKFEGMYEQIGTGYRLTLTVKTNGVSIAEPDPTYSYSSDKTHIAAVFIQMSRDAISSLSTDRGTRLVRTPADAKVLNYPLRSYALFIATNDYDDDTGWPDLANPICDAEAIKKELIESYGFLEEDISTAYNQDLDGMLNSIEAYRTKLLPAPAESDTALFVFIAGHGTYDEQRKRGMLAARNAKMRDERGNNYYRFSNLLDDISSLSFGHIFVVIDACQSGDAIQYSTDRGDVRTDAEFLVDKLKGKPTRKAFTSASYNNVPDGPRGGHSPFAERLLEAFRSYGNNDRFLTLDEIWTLGAMDKLTTSPRRGWFKDNAPGSDFLFIARPKAKEYTCLSQCNCIKTN